jgi:predicted N-acetyltransferase YhbS
MITIRHERPADAPAREALLDLSFGACRFAKTSQRLRDGRRPAEGLSFVAAVAASSSPGRRSAARPGDPSSIIKLDDRVKPGHDELCVGTVRLWHVDVGGRPALLLGPLAVHPNWRACGIGGLLMRRALAEASAHGHAAVLLVGDAPYYERFGFSADLTRRLAMPGPCEADRLLACELRRGALDGACGLILPAGATSDRLGRSRRGASVAGSPTALPRAA